VENLQGFGNPASVTKGRAINMKHCPYCGAEYPDEMTECSIDCEPLEPRDLQPVKKEKPKEDRYEIPPLSEADRHRDWVMILSPHSEFEANIVLNRLQVSGIRARFDDAVMGGGINTVRMRIIQVRVGDYERARHLLNQKGF
jgi:hypothetical protein